MRKIIILVYGIVLLSFAIAYSLTYQIKAQRVAVGVSATALPTTALIGREYIRVQNTGASTVYIGSSTVTANNAATGGLQLLPYMAWDAPYDNNVVIYGIVAANSCSVIVEEGK